MLAFPIAQGMSDHDAILVRRFVESLADNRIVGIKMKQDQETCLRQRREVLHAGTERSLQL